jgi:hypothetical protein
VSNEIYHDRIHHDPFFTTVFHTLIWCYIRTADRKQGLRRNGRSDRRAMKRQGVTEQ